MTEKLNIVQSTTEPDKRNIWLKDNELKKFGAKGWSTIGGGNAGGGTSTDKDALYIDLNYNDKTATVNDKKFLFDFDNGVIDINSKELYDILYNSLFNTCRHIFIKGKSDNTTYVFGQANLLIDKNIIILSVYTIDAVMSIAVYNQ